MRTAVITGASGGIGTAIALAFAGEGCNVVLQYNKGKYKAEALAEKIQKEYGVIALPVQADISSSQSVKSFFDEVEAKLSNVDVLVNNAGIAQQKLFTDITDEDWHRMIGTNLDGVFYCSREVLNRFMIKNHSGVILNISSMWGQAGASCEVHYSAAKAGVIGLTKALAKEVGLSNIRVNCIAPGVVMTDMMKSFDEQTINELKEETPLNMLGQPEDIAQTAVFLCSDKANFITGQVLGVNGGFII